MEIQDLGQKGGFLDPEVPISRGESPPQAENFGGSVTTIKGPEQFFISPRCVTNPMHVVGEPLDFPKFNYFYFYIFALKYF